MFGPVCNNIYNLICESVISMKDTIASSNIGISVGIYCKERKISYMLLYRLKDVDRYIGTLIDIRI